MALDRTWYNSLVDDDGSGLTGSVWDKADVNALMTAVDNELAPDTCSITAVSRQTTVTSGVWTALEFDTVGWQSKAGMFVPPGNLITIKTTGYYLITGAVNFPQGTGVRGLSLYVNGAAAAGLPGQQLLRGATSATYNVINLAALALLSANDYAQLAAYQDTGAPIVIGGIHPTATNHMQAVLLRK
jgi:hypothetical protein